MNNKKVFYYIFDKKLLDISKNIPNIGNRAAVVQTLIASYNLLSHCQICACEEATDEELLSFHSGDYVDCLKKVHLSTDLEKMTDSDEVAEFNLAYDCPLFERMYDFAKLIAGSSLTAARKLISNTFQVKKKAHFVATENIQPKSYLMAKSGLKRLKKTDDFDMATNLTTYEFHQNEDFTCENERLEKTQIVMYEREVSICSDKQPISINWFGGWHHAQRDEAGGFCYVNDIVIAIQYLLKFCQRVLYVDLDVHHGDGVENAFMFTPRVLTFSIHKFEPGFYPGTGSLVEVGKGNGKFYAVNVPLKSGITDERYVKLFNLIFLKIMKKYKPNCIVVQCGADCMNGDPLGGFNLTPEGLGKCLKLILDEKLPTLMLGGGGYNIVNTSKCWTYLTSVIIDCSISKDIPDNSFLHLYGPEFELNLDRGLRKDENSEDYLQDVLETVLDNLDNLPEESDC